MNIEEPRLDGPDGLDDAIRELIAARSNGAPDAGLHGRIVAQAAGGRQRRRSVFAPEWWSGGWPSEVGFGRARPLRSIAVVAAIAIVLIGGALLGGRPATTAPGGVGSSGSASPVATDAYPSAAPRVSGTCSLTPITRIAGGEAPEVDVSGLRWRWGDVPWVAGVDEKVVWLDDAGLMPLPGISVFATQLDEPILVAGHPTTFAKPTAAVYAAATDVQWVALIRLPNPGCWLLTAVWSAGTSSVVVAAATSPGPSPTEMASLPPLPNPGGTCSASQFVLGKAMNDGPGFPAWGTSDDFITQPLRDVGGNCVLHLPATIAVASASGPFQAVRVLNAGTVTSFSATSGGNVSIALGASWPIPWMWAQLEKTPPPCAGAISNVSRVEIPLASGSLQIDLGTVWPEVCPDPASVWLTFVTK
jgi:hypothetical protein